jgi:uncharacterized protein (DUF58 family)
MTVIDLATRLRRRRDRPVPPSTPPSAVINKSAVLRRLELDVRHRLDGRLTGEYLSAVIGPGSERAGARAYEPGDDARRMDWNLSARAIGPHVRTTEADRELETWVVTDRSASMDFGTAHHEKRELVLAALAAFGAITARTGNRLGVVIAGSEQLRRIPPANSRVSMLAALSAVYDTPRRLSPPDDAADLANALRFLDRTHVRRGQVVVVSDFLDRSDWPTEVRRLALRHQLICVQVTDPREFELPPVGILSVVDAESGRQMHVQTNSTSLRQRYADAAAERQQEIVRSITRAGAEHLHLSTDRDWLLDIVRFLSRRRHRSHALKDRP